MKQWTILRVGLWVLCFCFFPTVSWAATSQCMQQTWIAAGQRTVTPAVVTGTPLEHLQLNGANPAGQPFAPKRPDGGYLITGNKVDLVTYCGGFAYVRFRGPKRVSTGWVDAARIKETGPAHATLPSNAPTLCRAAEAMLNEGRLLAAPSESRLDTDDVLTRVHLGPFPNGSPPEVFHIVVDGRRMAALVVDDGGTSHDTEVYVFSDDLKGLLSPADREDRDVENTGDWEWAFGVSEDVVVVNGQPMVRSWGSRDGKSKFYLSIIDRDGDIVPTCEAEPEPRKERAISLSANDSICHAVLAGQPTPAPMHPPVPGESLVMNKVPAEYSNYGGSIHSTTTVLKYHDTARAAGVSYTLLRTGIADLDNSGHARQVGIVSFWEGDSSAGDGSYTDSQILPVYLDKAGVADLSTNANQKLASLPHGMLDGKLVTLNGTTYLELSPDIEGPSSEVWKIDSSGARQICGFKLTQEVVQPISE